MKIGEGLEQPEDFERSTFKSVSVLIGDTITTVENDLRIVEKNVIYIRQCLCEIENMNKESLVENTKEIGNNIIKIEMN